MLKSTSDVEGGRALYDFYSTVSDSGSHNFLRLRDTVLLRKEDRKMFVQANTRISGQCFSPVPSATFDSSYKPVQTLVLPHVDCRVFVFVCL